MMGTTKQGWLRHTAVAAVMGASLLWAGAAGGQTLKETCPTGQTLTGTDSKTCPDGKVLSRACCKKADGRVRCKSFAHCPSKSPSGPPG
jgi:hypothetical protein